MKSIDFNDNEILSYVSESNEEAINLIYEKYKPLINKIARRLYDRYCINSGLEVADLVQEGMLGLNNAMNTYSEFKDVLFYTYAKTCVERKMISAVIACNRKKHKILNESLSYEIEITEDLNIESLIGDEDYNPENIVIDMEEKEELLKKIKEKLTDFELEVLELKMDGFDYKEIASILDKDTKSIDNAFQRLKNKIKNIIKEDEK